MQWLARWILYQALMKIAILISALYKFYYYYPVKVGGSRPGLGRRVVSLDKNKIY